MLGLLRGQRVRALCPPASIAQKPVTAFLLIDQLMFVELYYLIMIEEVASKRDIRAVLHLMSRYEKESLAIFNRSLDRSAPCLS